MASRTSTAMASPAPAPPRAPPSSTMSVCCSKQHQTTLGAAALVAVFAVLAAGAAAILQVHYNLAPGESFAVIRSNSFIANPSPDTVRYRGAEYLAASPDRFFFQWWNYLIVDASSHEQYQLLFQLSHHSSRASTPLRRYSLTAAKHQLADKSSRNAALARPLSHTSITQPMDLHITDAHNRTAFTQHVVDDDTYELIGSYPAHQTSTGHPLAFHLTFHRIHGMYTSPDREADNVRSCTLISNHFAYSSHVTGWWADSPTHNLTFTRQDRFRAYAAASWGCQLPHTDTHEPHTFPWTWLWLAVPATDTTPELSLSLGTAKLEAQPLGALYAGISVLGVGEEVMGTTFAYAWHDSSFQLKLLSAASDGRLLTFNRSLSDWTNSSDDAGDFHIPLTQHYFIESSQWRLLVRVRTYMPDYFRAPVVVEDVHDGRLRLFSDFRACDNRVHVKLVRMHPDSDTPATLVYDGPALFNAAEYAYEAALYDSVPATIAKLLPGQPQSDEWEEKGE